MPEKQHLTNLQLHVSGVQDQILTDIFVSFVYLQSKRH